jgi:integrase
VLKDAVRWGYVVRNVADAADPPKVKPAELQVWSPGQLRAFLVHVQGDRQYAAWLLAATTGMRRGELLGLRWVDVDLDAARIAVRQPRVVADHAVHVSEPKTARSRRSIALDPVTVDALRQHQARQAADRAAVGPAYEDSGLVFTHPDGSPIHPPAVLRLVQAAPSRRRAARHPSARPAPQLRNRGARRRHPGQGRQ